MFVINVVLGNIITCTRWFKYDRDYVCVNKSQFVPVIFEAPCTLVFPATPLRDKLNLPLITKTNQSINNTKVLINAIQKTRKNLVSNIAIF
jgi:hypothetical protein